jgi:hypothetical protein
LPPEARAKERGARVRTHQPVNIFGLKTDFYGLRPYASAVNTRFASVVNGMILLA